jgi:hypothetical protein
VGGKRLSSSSFLADGTPANSEEATEVIPEVGKSAEQMASRHSLASHGPAC